MKKKTFMQVRRLLINKQKKIDEWQRKLDDIRSGTRGSFARLTTSKTRIPKSRHTGRSSGEDTGQTDKQAQEDRNKLADLASD